MIYLDNSATGWPRPDAVGAAMLAELGAPGNPGRGAYGPALDSGRLLYATRALAAELFGAAGPEQVVFTSGATLGLNTAIAGLLASGDHAVTTDLEHNAVLRPLYAARERGVGLTIVRSRRGVVDPQDVAAALRPNTALVVVTHGSNVLGTVQPVERLAEVCEGRGGRVQDALGGPARDQARDAGVRQCGALGDDAAQVVAAHRLDDEVHVRARGEAGAQADDDGGHRGTGCLLYTSDAADE